MNIDEIFMDVFNKAQMLRNVIIELNNKNVALEKEIAELKEKLDN